MGVGLPPQRFLPGLPGATPALPVVPSHSELLLGLVCDVVHFRDVVLLETVLLNVLFAESIIQVAIMTAFSKWNCLVLFQWSCAQAYSLSPWFLPLDQPQRQIKMLFSRINF